MEPLSSILCEEGSKRHIPSDVWPEILSRLPVKSLLRFRCVSKSWLSLIDDAEFIRLHLRNFKNNSNETHLFVVEGLQRRCVVRSSDSFEANSETLLTLGVYSRMPGYRENLWEVDYHSIDGLIVLRRYNNRVDELSEVKVWNPSIRKFHEFPSTPAIESETRRCRNLSVTHIGLGYDPLAKVYKYVKLIFLDDYPLHSVAIYTLGAGSWKIIKFQGNGSSCSKWHWVQYVNHRTRVYFQGCLYFIGEDVQNPSVHDLVSFDLSSETFSSMSLTDDPVLTSCYLSFLTVIDGGCSLALVDIFISDVRSVWVLENSSGESEAMYWTKRYSFRLEFANLLHFMKNGDILTRKRQKERLAITGENGKQKFLLCDQVTSYRPEADEEKILREGIGSRYEFACVCGYIESLILHK